MPFVTYDPLTHHLNYQFDYNPQETAELRAVFRNKKPLDLSDFRRVALWKLDRVIVVPDDTIADLVGLAEVSPLKVDSKESLDVLQQLIECEGVGFPMASAFLKFVRPNVFPIIDVRAYRALYGFRVTYSQYTLDRYLTYSNRVAEIASSLAIPLAEVDERLYAFDKHHNGPI